MRRLMLGCCAIALVGCNKPKEEPPMESTVAAPETPAAPAPIALADIAGKWSVRSMAESGTHSSSPTSWSQRVTPRDGH